MKDTPPLQDQKWKRSIELLQAVADGAPDVVYVKDIRSCYLLGNRALATFTGRSTEEIRGCDDMALYGDADAAALVEDDRTLFATSAVQSTERWLTGVSGRRLFFVVPCSISGYSGCGDRRDRHRPGHH